MLGSWLGYMDHSAVPQSPFPSRYFLYRFFQKGPKSSPSRSPLSIFRSTPILRNTSSYSAEFMGCHSVVRSSASFSSTGFLQGREERWSFSSVAKSWQQQGQSQSPRNQKSFRIISRNYYLMMMGIDANVGVVNWTLFQTVFMGFSQYKCCCVRPKVWFSCYFWGNCKRVAGDHNHTCTRYLPKLWFSLFFR